jgi:hypothetical protein
MCIGLSVSVTDGVSIDLAEWLIGLLGLITQRAYSSVD